MPQSPQTPMYPWEALLSDHGSLSSIQTEDVIKRIEELKTVSRSIDDAEARLLASGQRNSETLRALHQAIKDSEKKESDPRAEEMRVKMRDLLLQSCRLSSQQFEQGATLRAQVGES